MLAPVQRARELRREWERVLGGGRPDGVRAPVADSWQRSLAAGVDPSGGRLAPVAADREATFVRWDAHPLHRAAPLIRESLAGIAEASDHLLVVSDASGMLLQVEGNARVRSRAADSLNFTEGALWSEAATGTNAVGTVLATDRPVQIFATEHFMEVVQAWTCSAAPVHDPETGELLGVIDLTGLLEDVDPHSLAVATTTARAVEAHLRRFAQERDDRLRARHRGSITGAGERRALVLPTGRLLVDDPRGWLLGGTQLELPPGGGDMVLPSGRRAVAEPVGREEAFVVRERDGARAPRGRPSDALRTLTDEREALRRLAAAAAHEQSPTELFTAVAQEVAPLLGADDAALARFEHDGSAAIVAGTGSWGSWARELRIVERDESLAIAAVRRTGRPGRARPRYGSRSTVAGPVIVAGRLWGALIASRRRDPLPADTEDRMGTFSELVGVVIANAEARAELMASRTRVVAAADDARRRIQRDLHDGAQQRLVSAVVTLKLARQGLEAASGPAIELVDEALAHAAAATEELRELSHGILPAALSRGGLRAGIDSLVARVRLSVSTAVAAERLPAALEATAYFIVCEALTNAVRHAQASSARISADVADGVLRLEVRDDGVGGARIDGSSGLLGLRDRAAALDGDLRIESPPGRGTVVAAELPIPVALASS